MIGFGTMMNEDAIFESYGKNIFGGNVNLLTSKGVSESIRQFFLVLAPFLPQHFQWKRLMLLQPWNRLHLEPVHS